MTETLKLKNILNQSPAPKQKLVSLISSLNNDAINKSFEFDSESQNSLDNLELLRLEVKQLKRENQFLKKKIEQIKTHKPQPALAGKKKQSLNCLNILKKNALHYDSQQPHQKDGTLSFIFTEIQSILKSLASIHKLQIDENLWVKSSEYLTPRENCQEEETNWVLNDKELKQNMKKKLDLIALQKEDTRYHSLLEVFMEFYIQKAKEQSRIKQKIQKYTEKTIDIGKRLIENASIRSQQKSVKSSCVYSIKTHLVEEEYGFHALKGKQNFQYSNSSTLAERHQLSYSNIEDGKGSREAMERAVY